MRNVVDIRPRTPEQRAKAEAIYRVEEIANSGNLGKVIGEWFDDGADIIEAHMRLVAAARVMFEHGMRFERTKGGAA